MSETKVIRSRTRLSEFVQIRSNFYRSVFLPTDWKQSYDDSAYLVTSTIQEFSRQILTEFIEPKGDRAWTITGPYGTGKSAFMLFLADLFFNLSPNHSVAQSLRSEFLPTDLQLYPIFVQAERRPLALSIADGIAKSDHFSISIRKFAAEILENPTKDLSILDLLAECNKATPGGTVLIVDELGKYLEHASLVKHEDVYVLQQIAEFATRSENKFIFFGVLHSGFADYFAESGRTRQAEWQKVQGRFRDIPFVLPNNQWLELIGNSIENQLPTKLRRAFKNRINRIVSTRAFSQVDVDSSIKDLLCNCVPLHPVTTLLLGPLFRSKISQNERSLFSFLTDYQTYGFRFFLDATSCSSSSALYRLSDLYDYVVQSLGMSVSVGPDSRHWNLIDHAISRIPADAPPLTQKLVKTIGLLNLYGESVGLRASCNLLRKVFDNETQESIEDSLEILTHCSIVLYRKHSNSFGLWEGSDLDLNVVFEQAQNSVGVGPIHQRLQEFVQSNRVVARAHYVKTGTARSFEVRLTNLDSDTLNQIIKKPTSSDGILLFIFDEQSTPNINRRVAQISRRKSNYKPIISVIPKSETAIYEALKEFECWNWIHENQVELEGDPVARKEVLFQINNASERLENFLRSVIPLEGHVLQPNSSTWFFNGRRCNPQPSNPQEFQKLVSSVCESSYTCEPILRNELINRTKLSSAASGARRKLINLIMFGKYSTDFEIDGFPPESGMVQSILVAGGFLNLERFTFSEPLPNETQWHCVWKAIENLFKSSKSSKVPLNELYSKLRSPPFGLKDGVLPVLIALILRLKKETTSLYEEGVYVAYVNSEVLERLARNPELFSLRNFNPQDIEKQKLEAIAIASQFLREDTDQTNCYSVSPIPIEIAQLLVGMYSKLPPFAKFTKNISQHALAVRNTLANARDPFELLLKDLPRALEISTKNLDNSADTIISPLRNALAEIQNAYLNMLSTVEDQLAESFGLATRGLDLKRDISDYAKPLREISSTSTQIGRFIEEATHEITEVEGDWREHLARVVADGKPPSYWRDTDVEECGVRLRILAHECDRLTGLVALQNEYPLTTTVANIGIVEPGTVEQRTVIAFPKKRRDSITSLQKAIRAVLVDCDLPWRTKILALVTTTHELLQDAEETECSQFEKPRAQ